MYINMSIYCMLILLFINMIILLYANTIVY